MDFHAGLNFSRFTIKNTTGTIISVSIVDDTIPPTIGAVMCCIISGNKKGPAD